jgi:amino acid adenylation domain-containing protein
MSQQETGMPQLSEAKRALLASWTRGKGNGNGNGNGPGRTEIRHRSGETSAPLSFPQLRLWFLDQLVPDSAAYNNPIAVQLSGPVDAGLLRQCLQLIVDRHDALRTTIGDADGEPVQVVAERVSVALPVSDLSALPAGTRGAEVSRRADEDAAKPFDLRHGPLFRFGLLRLAPEEHMLMLNWSHLIFDGWSMQIFWNELTACYRALAGGQEPELTPLPVQYGDFAWWQRDHLGGATLQNTLAYWRARLAGAPTTLDLPTDYPRPAMQSFRGDSVRFTLGSDIVSRLRALSRDCDASLFMTFLTAFATVLSRWSGQQDMLVGTPIANRTQPELRGVFGFIANTLVLRVDLSGNPTFAELLARVRESLLQDYAHQDLPFEKLVDELRPDRSMSHNPLFQAMLTMNKAPSLSWSLDELRTTDVQVGSTGSAKFDLWLVMAEMGDELPGELEYATDLFSRPTAERLVRQLLTLLETVAGDPHRPLSALSLLDPAERTLVVSTFNQTAAPAEEPQLLHELISEQCRRTPSAAAVLFEGEEVSFAELDRWSGRIAGRLRQLGVGPDIRVAVCMQRCPGLVATLLAVLRAGGAYVPLEYGYPAARLSYLLGDCGAAVLVTDRSSADRLPDFAGAVLNIDELAGATDQEFQPVSVRPDDLAYVIYTSGSTGSPRGAMISHRAIVNRLRWMQRSFGLTSADRVLQKTPIGFDVSVWEFFWPLMTGATLVLARPEGHRDPSYLAGLIAREQVTTVHFVPSMLRLFLDEPLAAHCPSLLRVICSGEELPYALQRRFFEISGAELHNLYGPTEAAVDVTAWRCDRDDPGPRVPIGRPVDNTTIYVLDAHGQPTPVGVPGELHIGGIQVARGYLGRPELTDEKFVPDPFNPRPGGRMYRTGDLARWRPDGALEYLGRQDRQVKISGIRIEPGEVEAAMREHPSVRDVVVMARTDGGPGETGAADTPDDTGSAARLVAYVLPGTVLAGTALAGIAQSATRDTEEPAEAHVAQWAQVFNDSYQDTPADDDPELNLSSWTSSYTGAPIPPAEMREWVQDTVDLVLSQRPRRVLEIGCGTGLLLFRIAPHCESYHGTDISGTALDLVGRQIAGNPNLGNVRLSTHAAHDLDDIPRRSVDTVLINSVVQYFPDVSYLLDVLAAASELVVSGGRIVLGDLRSLELLDILHASIELAAADDNLPLRSLHQRVARRVWQEQELAVSPRLFASLDAQLARIGRAEVRLKPGGYRNELSRFRYDVILHVGEHDEITRPPTQWLAWATAGAERSDPLRQLGELASAAVADGKALGVTGLPNGRLSGFAPLAAALADPCDRTVGQLRSPAEEDPGEGVEPRALYDLAEGIGAAAQLCPSLSGELFFDVAFYPAGTVPPEFPLIAAAKAEPASPHSAANWPQQARVLAEMGPKWRDHLKDRVPEFAIPAVFVPVPEIPLSPNGKADHDRLPVPPPSAGTPSAELVLPKDGPEKVLATIWADVLGLESVGATDNYFALGGDSIRAVRVITLANRADLTLAPRDLFQHPTVAELAGVAEQRSRQEVTAQLSAQDLDDRMLRALSERDQQRRMQVLADPNVTDVYPLAPFQAHMLHEALNNPVPGQYLVQFIDSVSSIDVEQLERSWRRVTRQYSALRTGFVWTDLDEPLQVVYRETDAPFTFADWSDRPSAEQDALLAEYMKADQAIGCALTRLAMVRLFVAKVGEDAYHTAFSFTYLRLDGWSVKLILASLVEDYQRELTGQPPAPVPEEQFSTFVAWTRANGTSAATERFWRQALDGLPGPALLASCAPGNQPSGHGYVRQHAYLPAPDTERLRAAAKRLKMPPNVLMQAVWSVLMAHYSGRQEAMFGVYLNGRPTELPKVENIAGPTMSIPPMRIVLPPPDRPVTDLLEQVMRAGIDIAHHQYVAPGQFSHWAGMPEGKTLFDNYMVFQNLYPNQWMSPSPLSFVITRMSAPIRVDIMPGIKVGVVLYYERSLLSDESARTVLTDFLRALAALAEDPGQTIARLTQAASSDSWIAKPELIVGGELSAGQIAPASYFYASQP